MTQRDVLVLSLPLNHSDFSPLLRKYVRISLEANFTSLMFASDVRVLYVTCLILCSGDQPPRPPERLSIFSSRGIASNTGKKSKLKVCLTATYMHVRMQ